MSDQRNPMHDFGLPPTIEDITIFAQTAIAAIPREFMVHTTDIAVIVEERADDETLREMRIESPWELSGLYRGVPLPERSVMPPVRLPDRIFPVLAEAILLEWIETGEDLFWLVRSVVIHEIAHHFGFSDAEIEGASKPMGAGVRAVATASRKGGLMLHDLKPRVFAFPARGPPGRMRQRKISRQIVAKRADAISHRAFAKHMGQRVTAHEQRQPDRWHGVQQLRLPQRRAFGPRRRVATIRQAGDQITHSPIGTIAMRCVS